jgi:hypothetical protein
VLYGISINIYKSPYDLYPKTLKALQIELHQLVVRYIGASSYLIRICQNSDEIAVTNNT